MSGEELRAATQELVDDIDAGRMFMNKVLRVRVALAAPSTPEPSGPAAQALIRAANAPSVTEPDRLAVPHFRDTEAIWKAIEPFVRAAPSAEPALDVERLADAMDDAYTYDKDDGYNPDLRFADDYEAFWRPFAAAVIARLAEPVMAANMANGRCEEAR